MNETLDGRLLEFKNVSLTYHTKAGETVALDGGKLALQLKAGGGAFVIPYAEV